MIQRSNMNDYLSVEDRTLLLDEQKKIDVNDVNDPQVTNDQFLEAVFRNLDGKTRPIICSFIGHPGKVSSAKWGGSQWESGKIVSDGNNYFTLASFHPDWGGFYRRRKKTYAAQHALMLDDIGTKAMGVERLTIPPSWLLETSPGNFQAGYIFNEPIVDGAIAERLMDAIIKAGLCDPGAAGPMNRYARLPVGINGKHDPPFKCRLVRWHPERLYKIEDIVDGFGLDINRVQKKNQNIGQGNGSEKGIYSRVYIPRRQENPVLTKLKEQNLYLRPLGDDKHEIICFWANEHTDGLVGGTAYFEPSESFPMGGFNCFHGHCSHRTISDLCEKLGIDTNEARNRPTIRIFPGCLFEIIDYLERELATAGEFYQRGGLIVRIITDPGTKATSIRHVSVYAIIRALSRLVNFVRFDKRSREWSCCDPPELHCRIMHDAEYYACLPVLHGIARQPYLRVDGSLMAEPGYDRESGLFGLFDKQEFVVPDTPSQKDAKDALERIKSLFDEFRFKTEYDLSAALSAILTAAIRPSLSLAPMFHARAPQIASGKSYLITLIISFATASAASAAAFPADDEECRKLLLATLLTSPSSLCFDNVTSDLLPFKSLCSALTEEYLAGRILGVSKMATVSTRTLFLSSGNNVGPIKDMSRRVITINLDPACEVPAAREFKKQPVAMVLSNRAYYVSLALTIIRAWIVAGRPITVARPIATYSEWSELCRQPLLWLGCPDPAESFFQSMEQDPDRETLGRLLHAWYNCFGSRPVMIREAINRAGHELLEVFMDIAGDRGTLNNKRLGKWISRHASRIVDLLKFEKDSGTRSAEAWKVTSVKSGSDRPEIKTGTRAHDNDSLICQDDFINEMIF